MSRVVALRPSQHFSSEVNVYCSKTKHSAFGANDIVSTKIFDKRGDFDFDIFNFPF